jgi:hypothetical protein
MTRLLLSVWLLTLPAVALAQTVERVTDTELKAAYCLGVVRSQAEMVRGDLIGTALAGKKIVERESRLFDYLSAKGYLGGRETAGISTGIVRGKNDFAQCQSDPAKNECRNACPKPNDLSDVRANTKAFECIAHCSDKSDACKRMKTCSQDFLPF